MSSPSTYSRRTAISLAVLAASAGPSTAAKPARAEAASAPATAFGLEPDAMIDQSARLQAAIDQATARGVILQLPVGKIICGSVKLRPGSHIRGAAGAGTVLSLAGTGAILHGLDAHGATLDGMTLDGAMLPMDPAKGGGLLFLEQSRDVVVTGVTLRNARLGGVVLRGVGGRVHGCHISGMGSAALFSLDATGLDIALNVVSDCADNGILIWRTRHGEDGTRLTANRIARIRNVSGGTGQYGNGINIYRAARVLATDNIVSDCAYTAVRANEASHVQMHGNSVMRIGEVALYAEAADERPGAAGFEGAVITSNIIDHSATGIVVTNFNNGGRLAVIQGNLVRNLKRREHEKIDKRGEGIAVEADAVVANNVIEQAPTSGIMVGWGRHMREVVVTGNLIRQARIGIAVTGDGQAGHCLIANNIISGTSDGAIRAMDHARPTGADLLSAGAKPPRHVNLAGNTGL